MTEQPGMASREEWVKTQIHKASTYSCGKCGKRFATPHDVYDHLDAEHPAPQTKRKAKRKR